MKNTINWFEIPVTNMQKSVALYEAMLDTKITVADFGGMPHGVFPSEANCVTGALVVDPSRKAGRGGTVIYLDAPGIARCVSRAVEAGAKVVQPVTPIDPHGTTALIEDLDGNVIGLHEAPKK